MTGYSVEMAFRQNGAFSRQLSEYGCAAVVMRAWRKLVCKVT